MQRESLPGCCILLSLLLEVIIVTHYDSNAIKFGISTFGLQNQQQSCTPTVTVTQPSTATAAKHYHQTHQKTKIFLLDPDLVYIWT
jgi:hypothetical protein